ncbi:MAG TPA: hypothetical protein VKS21_10605, partial [Spirochaetota bacterium]|nr:hypothetical protein [Spirochaetota bacterium]
KKGDRKWRKTKQSKTFIACDDHKVYACVTLIKGRSSGKSFNLPLERYFDLSSYKDKRITPAEFSQLLIADDVPRNDITVKFLTFVLQYAFKNSLNYICTTANCGTDDINSARILYRIAQLKNMIHPSIKTACCGTNSYNHFPQQPLFSTALINRIKKYRCLDFKKLAELEKKGLQFPPNLQLFQKLGFQLTAVPYFMPAYRIFALPMVLELEKSRIKNIKAVYNVKIPLAPRKEINCRSANTVIQYVKSRQGNIRRLLKDVEYSLDYLTNENNWVDCRTIIKLFANARKLFHDTEIGYKIGLSSVRLKSLGAVNTLYSFFGNPGLTYKMIGRFQNLWNLVQNFKIIKRSRNKIEIIISKGPINSTRDICEFNRGLITSIQFIWNISIKVKETECVRRGDPRCKYVAQWKPLKSVSRRIYYFTVDKLSSWFKLRKIIKQKKQQLKNKYTELKNKSRENINLKNILHEQNKQLQKIINRKKQYLQTAYNKKQHQYKKKHHLYKNTVTEKLIRTIAHEIKNNLTSVQVLTEKITNADTVSCNQQKLLAVFNFCRRKLNRENMARALAYTEEINTIYNNFNFITANLQQTVNETNSILNRIQTDYRSDNSPPAGLNTIIREIADRYKTLLKKNNVRLK